MQLFVTPGWRRLLHSAADRLTSSPGRLSSSAVMRHAGALLVVAAAMLLRLAFEAWLGPGLPPDITFYPAVMVVAILAGFAPGMTATFAAAVVSAYWIVPPVGKFSLGSSMDVVVLAVFVATGLFINVIAELYRRDHAKAAAYDRAAAALRSSEDARREREALFRAIFDHNLDGALLTTPDGAILAANAEACRMLGYDEDELRLLGRRGVVDDGDPRLAPALAQRAVQGHFRGELTMIGAGGRKFPVELSSSVFIGPAGQVMTSMLLRDISERQRSEAALRAALAEAERANSAKSRFLAAATHDLRQPLAALSLYAGVLKTKADPAHRHLVTNMHACIAGLGNLLTDLLDLSKLDAGVITPCPADFPIAEMFANLRTVHAPEAGDKGLQLRFAHSRLTGRSDPVLFNRILGNFVDNALRYTQRGGVLIACRRRRGKTWVEVWDTGIGIPAEQIGDIFEEFKQLGDGARNKGSGLGLAIAAKMAALLGLEIYVRSRLGRGSLFAVELPLGDPEHVLPTATPHAAPRRPLRVALVEDNVMVREAFVLGLRGLGHEVIAGPTRTALLSELGALAPDIVVSDYRLTQGDTGYDVITEVRARYGRDLPAVLVTGDTDPDLLRSMRDRGITVLHKPVDLDALQDCLAGMTFG